MAPVMLVQPWAIGRAFPCHDQLGKVIARICTRRVSLKFSNGYKQTLSVAEGQRLTAIALKNV